jgi:TolA-binding protein
MSKMLIRHFLAGLFLALTLAGQGFAQSPGGKPPDTSESGSQETQASSLIDAERVAKAEERIEAMRTKLVEIQMQELDLQARLDDLEFRLSPDSIQRALAFVGSVRPMDEMREALRVRLESERARVNRRLELLASSRERLEAAISRAEDELERLRERLRMP